MEHIEEILVDNVELLQRAIEACEKSQLTAGLILVDDEGNFVKHIDFSRDPEPLREQLKIAQNRLDAYREGLVL